MIKLLFSALMVFLLGCNNAGNRTPGGSLGLTIKIVDESSNAFEVQTVRWWYSGDRNNKHELQCTTDLCAEWVIGEELSGSIEIHADASRVKQDDENCWDLYNGKAVVEMPADEVVIVVAYTNTACS